MDSSNCVDHLFQYYAYRRFALMLRCFSEENVFLLNIICQITTTTDMLCVFFRVGTEILYVYICHIRFLLKF